MRSRGVKKLLQGVLLLGASMYFVGCAAQAPAPAPVTIRQAPTAAVHRQTLPVSPAEGSLWTDNGGLGCMFINVKARNVGDILTIRIVETANATNKASTKTERSSSLSAGIDNFFNAEKRFPPDQPFFNPFGKVSGSIDSEFDGSGKTVRSGDLNAFMTARVVDIHPNGNLVIEGNREVRVNHENQIITLTGLVRPRDISADNVVQSTYIADARISYSGTGILNDRQKPGWLTRVMDVVWPF